jgi:uncharacterized protein (TIGR02246 family)
VKRISLLLIAPLISGTSFSVLAEPENKSENNEASPALIEARKAIDKGNAQWIDAWDKADASLIAGLFAPDGVMLGSNGKFFKSPKQILEHLKPVMEGAGKGVKATVTTVDLWLDGDTAYETGRYSYKFPEKSQPVTEEGRYVTIWKRQTDGSWKIIMDMGVPKN